MVEEIVVRARNVIDLSAYRLRARSATARPLSVTRAACSHCGAWMAEGESEDECSARDTGAGFRATGV